MSSELRSVRRKRGIVRGQVTRIRTRLSQMSKDSDDPQTVLTHARRMASKLEELDTEFKIHHFTLVELIEKEDDLESEQMVLDEHEDIIADLTVQVEQLITSCNTKPDRRSETTSILCRKLAHLEKRIDSVGRAMDAEESIERCVIEQCRDQVSDCKEELSKVRNELLTLEIDDGDEICHQQTHLEEGILVLDLKIRKLLQPVITDSSSPKDGNNVRLPKLEIPSFSGDLLDWRSFWEQFSISVHDKTSLSNPEKLVYLRQALKDGIAKQLIDGLADGGDCYPEAIECLRLRFDRPRLIHQAHVKAIIEAPAVREGNGKELRRLHDILQQHLRALRAIGHDPSASFITSLIELKLDATTTFEWQRYSQDQADVPRYQDLMEFIDLRARASEVSSLNGYQKTTSNVKKSSNRSKHVASYTVATAEKSFNPCVLCKTVRHPLYTCTKFRSLSHANKMATLKANGLCINCLKMGHLVSQCRSSHHCKVCQKPHHTLMHIENRSDVEQDAPLPNPLSLDVVTSHTAIVGLKANALLMTCKLLIEAPSGSIIEARGLLDSASSVSFVSERIVQALRIPRSRCNAQFSGIAGMTHSSDVQSIATFNVYSRLQPKKAINITAIILPRVTSDLPSSPISFDPHWSHISDIQLADSSFGLPGRIDLLLGADIFSGVLLQGRRKGPPNTPSAVETEFGWVLVGPTDQGLDATSNVVVNHASVTNLSTDDLLKRFWKVEQQNPNGNGIFSLDEKAALQHYHANHRRHESGRFIVSLPRREDAKLIGESRSKAVRRYLSLERSLISKNQKHQFDDVLKEYFDLGHAERVPHIDLQKPFSQSFYLPMHTVRKDSSTTTKLRVVFDASAKSATGVSFNDTLLVGPTIHPPLVDILIRFRSHRVALTADVSKMYRAVELAESDRDFHRFVWREKPSDVLLDYRMTRVTFGVSASSFAAIMSMKQNVSELSDKYPLAYKAVCNSFYVDDGLTGADSVTKAIKLQRELQQSFELGGFILRKWSSSNPNVLKHLPAELKAIQTSCSLPDPNEYVKTLGIEWNSTSDHFRLAIADWPVTNNGFVTKRILISDIAKTFDVLGWFAPAVITVKILLQRVWEERIEWDEPVPSSIYDTWTRWRSELMMLSTKHIPRCYFPKDCHITTTEIHGFSDASERAYAAVVYLRMVDTRGEVHTSIVTSKTKVAPIKRLTIPRLELCGAHLLSQLISHVRVILSIPLSKVFAWTDSTVVLHWLRGNPHRFKTFVGNRVSDIIDVVPPNHWKHVNGWRNPADCASRGLFPAELVKHDLWWSGPEWLSLEPKSWPIQNDLKKIQIPDTEELKVSPVAIASVITTPSILPASRYSSFDKLKYVTGWIFRFINKCRGSVNTMSKGVCLSVDELRRSENYWLLKSQAEEFASDIMVLKEGRQLPRGSKLKSLTPFLDESGILRVSGRQGGSKRPYDTIHPIILHGRNSIVKLVIRAEHFRLMHAGSTLVLASLSSRFVVIGGNKVVRSIIRQCVTCRKFSARPMGQKMGNLPAIRTTPGHPFEKVGVDYAGPFLTKYGYVRKPTIVKSYVCVFVCLTIKAVHLELVSDLTTSAFLSCLRRFISRRGKPTVIMSDHGTNFIGADRELKELYYFLQQQMSEKSISEFCSYRGIKWSFIPEHTPHFGGIWEAAVKRTKYHLKRVVGETKLTFEELSTLLTGVEACLNSRPLTPLQSVEDAIEVLTPGHFLIGRPLEALPNQRDILSKPISLLSRWYLAQSLIQHFWKRWSQEYLASLRKTTKWHFPNRDFEVGDIVILKEDCMFPSKWPLARIVAVHPGKDKHVRVVTIKTPTGTYKRPVSKLILLVNNPELTPP